MMTMRELGSDVVCFVLKEGQVLAERMGLCKGNSSRGDNPGKGLEVRKKLVCPGSYRQFGVIGP